MSTQTDTTDKNETPAPAVKRRPVRKTVRVLLGLDAFDRAKKSFRSLLWNQSSQWGYETTVDALNAIRRGRQQAETARAETFEEAIERLEIPEERLAERHADLAFQASMLRGLAYASAVAGIVAAIMSPSFFWFCLLVINGLGICGMFFGMTFSRTFRAWQIEKRSLMSVAEFMASGGIYRVFLW